METAFTSYVNKDVGTSAATIVTAATSTQVTLIGMSCSNTTVNPVTVDVYITRSATNYYLVKGATVPVGGSLVTIGGDQKVVLIAGDILKVLSSVASSIDVITSSLVTS